VQPKPRTLGRDPLTRAELRTKALLDQYDEPARRARRKLPVLQMPATRAGCADIPRPCPFVRCTKNNYLTVNNHGVIKKTFPGLEPWEMNPTMSCSADIAERGEDLKTVNGSGGATVEEVAAALNMTAERVRQIQVDALKKVLLGLQDYVPALRDVAPERLEVLRRWARQGGEDAPWIADLLDGLS
jgi:hypothetical protein